MTASNQGPVWGMPYWVIVMRMVAVLWVGYEIAWIQRDMVVGDLRDDLGMLVAPLQGFQIDYLQWLR
jgi:hypothetical protein